MSAAYLAYGTSYDVLKTWKKKRGPLFDQFILKVIHKIPNEVDVITAVPTRRNRLLVTKGGAPLAIAKFISSKFEKPLIKALVQKNDVQQAKSKLYDRLLNPPAFALIKSMETRIKKRHILLVDDFSTSLQTIKLAAKTLLDNGAKVVHGFVLGLRPTLNQSQNNDYGDASGSGDSWG